MYEQEWGFLQYKVWTHINLDTHLPPKSVLWNRRWSETSWNMDPICCPVFILIFTFFYYVKYISLSGKHTNVSNVLMIYYLNGKAEKPRKVDILGQIYVNVVCWKKYELTFHNTNRCFFPSLVSLSLPLSHKEEKQSLIKREEVSRSSNQSSRPWVY